MPAWTGSRKIFRRAVDGGPSWPAMFTTAVEFDGTNDYQTLGVDPTGIVDSKGFTVGGFFKLNASRDGAVNVLFANGSTSGGSGFYVAKSATGTLTILPRNAAGTALASPSGPNAPNGVTSALGWFWGAISFDFATGRKQIAIGNTIYTSSQTLTDDFIDFTKGNFSFGALTTGTNKFAGCVCAQFFHTVSLDLSNTAVRRKFITAAGLPVDIALSDPFGVTPLIWCPGGDLSGAGNLGTAGPFTTTGALTACPDSPNPSP